MNDDPSLIYWGYTFNVDYLGNLWVADSDQHTIFYISKELETWNAIFEVSGVSGRIGMRNGNLAKATFNKPSSIVIYDRNSTAIKMM